MKRALIGLTVMLAMAAPLRAEELSGRQIIDQAIDRHEAPYDFEQQIMTLIDKKGNRELRDTRRYARKGADGQFKYLIVFDSPPGVKGVALLTWQHEAADDDQWLYLPAQGDQVKRIAKGSKKNYFMGTDFTYEDLVSESREKFTYARLPDETLEGATHYVVEITPADAAFAKESGYQKRVVWVRHDNFFVIRTDYYDKQGKLVKRQSAGNLESVGGDMWRAKTTNMENFSNGHATHVQVETRKLEEAAAPEELFQQRFLTSGQHMR
ncbi:MAG: outer membrane lipoprotein-sorting protein [Candidatus Omnitrophica bacterium]|nr:outer membrane lipoprotein-sorting protein [Candidatus Omnitrophota bacterium]